MTERVERRTESAWHNAQGKGPIECLKAHVDDPGHVNIFTSKVGPEATVAVIALSLAPIIIEAKKALDGGEEEEFKPIPW